MRLSAPAWVLGLALPLLICAGCSQKPQPTGPNLVSADEQQRSRIEVATNSGSFGNITEKLGAIAQDVYAGTAVSFVANALNTGKASEGVRVLVKGTAIANGYLGNFEAATLRATNPNGKEDTHEVDMDLRPTADGSGYEFQSLSFKYGDKVDVYLRMKGLKNGTGDVVVFLYPLDPKGKSTAVFQKNYRVLSEHDDSEPTEGQ